MMTPTLSDLKALDAKATRSTWLVTGKQSIRGARGEYIAKANWNNGEANAAFIVACVAYVRAELERAEGE